MVNVKRRIVSRKEYYYLEHSMRNNGKVVNKTKYLGDSIPGNIEKNQMGFYKIQRFGEPV